MSTFAATPNFDTPVVHLSLRELVDNGGRITRVRWLKDYIPGRGWVADLSYVHGTLADGTRVNVTALPSALLIPLGARRRNLVEWAMSEGVYAKGCGLLDDSVESVF